MKHSRQPLSVAVFAVAAFATSATNALGQQTVLSEGFDSVVSLAVSPGAATPAGVQGFSGLGPGGNQFGGQFLRSPTGNEVSLTLTGLPAHTGVSVLFLFAAIDSLDGTGASPPQGDFLNVKIDGVSFFRESFANADPGQTQSYVSPPGVQLARRVDLGFSGPGSYYTDSAYDLSADPVFHNRPHSASSLSVSWVMEGPGIQPLTDESWAMDNLRIVLEGVTGGCGPADVGSAGGIPGADGLLDNNDFIAFITYFFNADTHADLGVAGGLPGQDGQFDNNDFIAFISHFFDGC